MGQDRPACCCSEGRAPELTVVPTVIEAPLPNPYMGWGIWAGPRDWEFKNFTVRDNTTAYPDNAPLSNATSRAILAGEFDVTIRLQANMTCLLSWWTVSKKPRISLLIPGRNAHKMHKLGDIQMVPPRIVRRTEELQISPLAKTSIFDGIKLRSSHVKCSASVARCSAGLLIAGEGDWCGTANRWIGIVKPLLDRPISGSLPVNDTVGPAMALQGLGIPRDHVVSRDEV